VDRARLPSGPARALPHVWRMPHQFARLRHFNYIGIYRYFLTFCTHERRPYFLVADHVAPVREQFLRTAREAGFALIVYCFMPDHVHLLVEGRREDADLRRFIKASKQYSGFDFQQRRQERLWQRYGYERVLRGDEATPDVVRYTLANPVRRAIVASPEEYAFWGSSIYSREELLEYARTGTGCWTGCLAG
jgi:putative transposase